MRHLPNTISCLRILVSLTLPLLIHKPLVLIAAYLLCGISDLADGYLARLYRLETGFGAKLDSLADFIFLVVTLLLVVNYIYLDAAMIFFLLVITLIRLANFVLTRMKFKQWGLLHTYSNKATGLIIFISIPVFVHYGSIPHAWASFLAVAAVISSLEEGLILLTATCYDPNRKSYFL